MLRCRTSVTWTMKRLRTTEMTTARARACTISRAARHENGASGCAGRVDSVSTGFSVSHDGCRARDHVGRTFFGEREDVAVEAGALVVLDTPP